MNIIHILGASGAGTSTLGQALEQHGYKWLDTDNYFWLPTDPPFVTSRPRDERTAPLKADINANLKCVITGSLCGWGDVFIPQFDLVIWVDTPTDIRIERLKKREYKRFGERIRPGGDMYDEHIEFIEWAKTYDTAGTDQRSRAMHDEWLHQVLCPVIKVDGTKPIEELICYILRKAQIYSFFGKTVTVTVDRQIGTAHPKHSDIIYPINYGYIAGEIAPDGEDLDVYILGVTEPLTTFKGKVIAIIHRENDIEDKLVIAPDGHAFNQAEVAAAVHFQEQFYTSTIDCLWRKSAGMIVFRRDADAVRYLLLFQSESQTWSFPKGHMEAGETEEQAAIREVREEIGQNLTPLPNFRAALSYDLKQGATKTVALFLAEANGEVVIRESEIAEHRWVTAEEATELLPHANYAEILVQAERRIAK